MRSVLRVLVVRGVHTMLISLRKLSVFAAAAVAALLLGIPKVDAATVSPQIGTVLIGKDQGFVPISGSVELAPGGRIMVRPGGVATITYGGTCTVRVGSGFWLVQEAAPCTAGETEIDLTNRMAGGMLDPPPPQRPRRDHLVLGGVIVGGAIAACVFWWCRDDDKPVSP